MKFLLLSFSILSSIAICSQNDSTEVVASRYDNTLLPFAFYIPETSLGVGGLGMLTFRRKGESLDTRPCQLIYSIAYTLKNQLLAYVPFQYYMDNEKKRIEGELGYYLYFYNYYGLGPDSKLDDEEVYSVNYPRFHLRYMQSVYKQHFLGFGLKYDFYDIQEFDEEGRLGTSGLPGVNGGDGYRSTVNYLFDSRNHGAFPTKGLYVDVNVDRAFKSFLSESDYSIVSLDSRFFQKISDEIVLANQLYFATATSETPFYYKPRIATQKIARGIANRRFIADQLTSLQTELRYPIYNRLKGVGFISLSNIGNTVTDESMKYSGGIGFRYVINEMEKTRIRIDIGTSRESLNFYITLKEAF